MNNTANGGINIKKRQSPRFEERDKITVTVLSSPDSPEIEHKKFHCWTQDLSESGLKFKAHSHVPIGSLVNVEILFLSDGEVFRHVGKVMWEQEFDDNGVMTSELGIKFTKMLGDGNQLESWKAAIKNRLEQ